MACLKSATPEARKTAWQRIHRQIDRITGMVNDILEFTRGGSSPHAFALVDYATFVRAFGLGRAGDGTNPVEAIQKFDELRRVSEQYPVPRIPSLVRGRGFWFGTSLCVYPKPAPSFSALPMAQFWASISSIRRHRRFTGRDSTVRQTLQENRFGHKPPLL